MFIWETTVSFGKKSCIITDRNAIKNTEKYRVIFHNFLKIHIQLYNKKIEENWILSKDFFLIIKVNFAYSDPNADITKTSSVFLIKWENKWQNKFWYDCEILFSSKWTDSTDIGSYRHFRDWPYHYWLFLDEVCKTFVI